MTAPLPREGERYRDPAGRVWRVACVGETFVTLSRARERRYFTHAAWRERVRPGLEPEPRP